ncbi:tetratricopeptide repeat protein [Candidatus Poribacteria bacterium]|nr:tetratricopeptide repeat protein [Candidatus Poribacteria bacterium]
MKTKQCLKYFMRFILLSCFVFLFIGCGPKSIPFSQKTDVPEPSEAARAHYQWGLDYAKNGDLHRAVTEFKMAILLESRWAIPYYNLGSVYGNMGEINQAILAWERATQLDPDFAKAHYNLAVAYAVKADEVNIYSSKTSFIEKTLVHLREAIRTDKTAHNAAKMESAFDNIRELPEYKSLFESAESIE